MMLGHLDIHMQNNEVGPLAYTIYNLLQKYLNVKAKTKNSKRKIRGKSFLLFLATPQGLQDLSSPTRDQTWALSSESMES